MFLAFLRDWIHVFQDGYPRPGDEQPANPNLLARVARSIGRSLGGDEVVTRAELREEYQEHYFHSLGRIATTRAELPGLLPMAGQSSASAAAADPVTTTDAVDSADQGEIIAIGPVT